MRVLIDTDKLDIEKGVEELPEAENYISIITLYEYVRGRSDYKEAKQLLKDAFVIIPLSSEVLIKATEIWRDLKFKGQAIDDRDLLIGATAIIHDLKLYTKNRKHFERLVQYGLAFLKE